MEGRVVPDIIFKTRVRDDSIGGDNPFRWHDLTSRQFSAIGDWRFFPCPAPLLQRAQTGNARPMTNFIKIFANMASMKSIA